MVKDWQKFHAHLWAYKGSLFIERREGWIDGYQCFCGEKLYGERKLMFQEPDGSWRKRSEQELVHPDNPDFRTTVLGPDPDPIDG